ncbi:hypothetical protein EMPS_02607 [Entomortierella parvispora]|uniref:2Fe-2S ferredoxin-type domain-containing protein n=1 Tax=Entomortierella parvispora TaxID=205924 RepID=A0A9P3H5S7_9FUNG|nr:hypothetical protein EMPS_02607 [Entomortierella parvispora]
MAAFIATSARSVLTKAASFTPRLSSAFRSGSASWTQISTSGSSHFVPKTARFSTASGILYTKKGRPGPGQGFQVNFVMQDGEEITVQAHEGESLLDVAWANDIDIEGACEASLACSTCHLILDESSYSKLEEPTDEENDMLDLAFGLTDTSRLGCQVLMNKELDGIVARLPSVTRNAQQ